MVRFSLLGLLVSIGCLSYFEEELYVRFHQLEKAVGDLRASADEVRLTVNDIGCVWLLRFGCRVEF